MLCVFLFERLNVKPLLNFDKKEINKKRTLTKNYVLKVCNFLYQDFCPRERIIIYNLSLLEQSVIFSRFILDVGLQCE